MKNNKKKGEKKKSSANGLLIGLLVLSVAGNVVQLVLGSQVSAKLADTEMNLATVEDEKIAAEEEFEAQLAEKIQSLEEFETENADLKAAIEERVAELEATQADLKKAKGNAAYYRRLYKKFQKENKEFQEKIAALTKENDELKGQNQLLADNLTNITEEKESLKKVASQLSTSNMSVESFRKRNNQTYKATTAAKKTNKLDVCFNIDANSIAEKGNRRVHVQIINPALKILPNPQDGAATFTKESGEEALYSMSEEITYDQNEVDNLCMTYEVEESIFTPGEYSIEVYIDGKLAGTSSTTLE